MASSFNLSLQWWSHFDWSFARGTSLHGVTLGSGDVDQLHLHISLSQTKCYLNMLNRTLHLNAKISIMENPRCLRTGPDPPPPSRNIYYHVLFWILVFSTSIGMIYNMYPMYCAMKLYHSPKLSLLNIVRNDRLGGGVLFGKRQCIQAYMCTTCTIFLCWFSFYRNELICYIIKSIKTRLYSNKSIQFYQNIILHLGPLSKP